MEGLLLLLGELIFMPLVLVLSFCIEGIILLFGASCELAFNYKKSLQKEQKADQEGFFEKHGKLLKRIFKTITFSSLIILIFLTVTVFVINTFFFHESVSFVIQKTAPKAGLSIKYDQLSGSLFSGELNLKNLEIQRQSGEKDHFDLKINTAQLDIDIQALCFGKRHFQKLSVDKITGNYSRKKILKSSSRPFVIDHFSCNEAKISYSTVHTPIDKPIDIEVEKFDSKPLRSQNFLFDLLFRSNIKMKVDSQPVIVSVNDYKTGKETRWQGTLNSKTIQKLTNPTFFPLTSGEIKIDVSDKWTLQEPIEIDLDWNLKLSEAKIEIPKEWPLKMKLVSKPVAFFINRRKEPLDLGFSLKISEEDFEGDVSPDLKKIFDKYAVTILKQIKNILTK